MMKKKVRFNVNEPSSKSEVLSIQKEILDIFQNPLSAVIGNVSILQIKNMLEEADIEYTKETIQNMIDYIGKNAEKKISKVIGKGLKKQTDETKILLTVVANMLCPFLLKYDDFFRASRRLINYSRKYDRILITSQGQKNKILADSFIDFYLKLEHELGIDDIRLLNQLLKSSTNGKCYMIKYINLHDDVF